MNLNRITATIRTLSEKHVFQPLFIGTVVLGTMGAANIAMANSGVHYVKDYVESGWETVTFGEEKHYNAGACGDNAEKGEITINVSCNVDRVYYGGYASNGTAQKNTITMTAGGGSLVNLFGGYVENGNATNNKIYVNEGEAKNLYGGRVENGKAENNFIKIDKGTIYTARGGSAETNGDANKNTVEMHGGTLNIIYGGWASNNASENKVEISGGKVGTVVGSYGKTKASQSTVTISGTATVTKNVYGGSTMNGKATDNVVVLKDSPTLEGVQLFGGSGSITGGNTLEVWSQGIAVKSLQNFENFLFVLPQEALSQDKSATPTLSVQNHVAMDDIKVAVALGNGVKVKENDTATLIDGASGDVSEKALSPSQLTNSEGKQYTVKGGDVTDFIKSDVTLKVNDSKLVATFTNVKANDDAKAVAESQIANMALLTQGSNLVAGEAMQSALDSVVLAKKRKAQGTGGVGFGAISGGYSRYDTGSSVKLSSFEFIAGYAQSTKAFSESKLTVGGFLEAGYGDYDTHTNDVRGDGKSRYVGVGFLTQLGQNNDFGPYGEFSFRLGRASNDWDGPRGMKADIVNFYCGTHIGMGYRADLSDGYVVDFYGKGFWTHQNGKEANVKGSEFEFDGIDSLKTRIGLRVTNREKSGFMPYIGLAWDHEFTAKAKGTINGIAIDAPKLKGDTTLAEAGFTYQPTEKSNWKVTVKASGYTGVRKGITGHVLFESRF